MDKRFEVQCGTVFKTIYDNTREAIVTHLTGRNSVNAQGIVRIDDREVVVFGGGTTTAEDIKELTGERWDLDRLMKAVDLGIELGLPRKPEGIAEAKIQAAAHLKREYQKPPKLLTSY